MSPQFPLPLPFLSYAGSRTLYLIVVPNARRPPHLWLRAEVPQDRRPHHLHGQRSERVGRTLRQALNIRSSSRPAPQNPSISAPPNQTGVGDDSPWSQACFYVPTKC
jgi:hypothetical protein